MSEQSPQSSPQSGQTENPKSDEDKELERLEKLAKKLNSATNTDKLDEKNRQQIQDAQEKKKNLETELESKKSELVNISSDKDETTKKYIEQRKFYKIENTELKNLVREISILEKNIENQNDLINSKKIEIASRRKSNWQPKPRKTRNTSRQRITPRHLPVNEDTMNKINKRKQNQEEYQKILQEIENVKLKQKRKEEREKRQKQLQKVEKSTKKKRVTKGKNSKNGSKQKYSIYHQYTF